MASNPWEGVPGEWVDTVVTYGLIMSDHESRRGEFDRAVARLAALLRDAARDREDAARWRFTRDHLRYLAIGGIYWRSQRDQTAAGLRNGDFRVAPTPEEAIDAARAAWADLLANSTEEVEL